MSPSGAKKVLSGAKLGQDLSLSQVFYINLDFAPFRVLHSRGA